MPPPHGRGRDPDDRPRAGRLTDRDQAAGDERRRVLQLELVRALREPERADQLPRDVGDPADPGRAMVFMFGRMVGACARRARSSPPWWRCSPSASRLRYPTEQHGSQVLRDSGVNIASSSRQSGGNMSDKEVRFGIANTALWAIATTDASNGSVNGGHDAFTAVRRRRATRQHVLRRGGLRRRRLGSLRHVLLRADRGVRRRPDGRTHARVPGQEDRGAGDQVSPPLGALFVPSMVLVLDRDRRRHRTPASRRSSTRARTASPRPCTPTRRSRTTTAARSPATGRLHFSAHLGTRRPVPRPLRPAVRRAGHRRRAGRQEDRCRPPPGRSAPTARRSPSCSWASSPSPPA